jgi:hypothetical protein
MNSSHHYDVIISIISAPGLTEASWPQFVLSSSAIVAPSPRNNLAFVGNKAMVRTVNADFEMGILHDMG